MSVTIVSVTFKTKDNLIEGSEHLFVRKNENIVEKTKQFHRSLVEKYECEVEMEAFIVNSLNSLTKVEF